MKNTKENKKAKVEVGQSALQKVYDYLARRPYTVILIAALLYNVCYKFLQAHRIAMYGDYWKWILSDIAFILSIEMVFAFLCFKWPRRRVVRSVTFISALICTWSVINAAWIKRTGTQILPSVLLPMFRSPVHAFSIVGGNLRKSPGASVILLGFSAVLLMFFFHVMYRSPKPRYNPGIFYKRMVLTALVVISAWGLRIVTANGKEANILFERPTTNCHLRAFVSIFSKNPCRLSKVDFINCRRKLPLRDQVDVIDSSANSLRPNIVVVILEGVQYQYTSLADVKNNRTPFLASLAENGIELTNARCVLTHTTKAIFGLLTGRKPSVSQDIAEAVPVVRPYASLATILEDKLGYRSAFFQSAMGDFECRPGLVNNLGFNKFWSREQLPDEQDYVGYLGSDEFKMIEPICNWIKSNDKPFITVALCSVTHDPYLVPEWFAEPEKEPIESYFQTIVYTDRFISELHTQLTNLGVIDNTLFCVVGDHGEAFEEHGFAGHERIAFEEVLHIPMVIKGPDPQKKGIKIAQPASSLDFMPTLLGLMDLQVNGLDGNDMFTLNDPDRKVYFAGWLEESPIGFVQGSQKHIYFPVTDKAYRFDLLNDPCELSPILFEQQQIESIRKDLANWRKQSLFKISYPSGKRKLFDNWKCRWTDRISRAKYIEIKK